MISKCGLVFLFFSLYQLLHCLVSYTFSHIVSVVFDQPTGSKKENGNNTIEKSCSIGFIFTVCICCSLPAVLAFQGVGVVVSMRSVFLNTVLTKHIKICLVTIFDFESRKQGWHARLVNAWPSVRELLSSILGVISQVTNYSLILARNFSLNL